MYQTPDGNFITPRPRRAKRKIKMGVQGHFTGRLVVGDDEGEVMENESYTEAMTAVVMLARRNVVGLENHVPFQWIDDGGEPRTHFFDFRVTHSDGTRVALIVKHSRKAAKDDFRREMRSLARQVPSDFADCVCLFTEKHIDPVELHNAQLIHSVRQPDPEPDAAVRRALRDVAGAVKIGALVAEAGCGGSGFRAVVRLIRTGEIEMVAQERIDHDSLVRWSLN